MTTTLPVPVRFALPGADWEPVAPESLGVRNAAFLAVRRGLPGDYDPTLTISGDWRLDDASLEQIADESVDKLRREGAAEVELLKRRTMGAEHAPAVTQAIGAMVSVEGRGYDLRQAQVVQGIVDVDDPAKRVVVIYTLTCTYGQWEQMVPEFQAFMASVEVVPEQPDEPDEPGDGAQ
jgi:hypothetical protein